MLFQLSMLASKACFLSLKLQTSSHVHSSAGTKMTHAAHPAKMQIVHSAAVRVHAMVHLHSEQKALRGAHVQRKPTESTSARCFGYIHATVHLALMPMSAALPKYCSVLQTCFTKFSETFSLMHLQPMRLLLGQCPCLTRKY